ncbi:DNA-binding protein RFX2-like isoform X3 [Artemia franciscana]|uniref:DNA-binding protein RFX2-like isoform X3 n=1 Tax=Artemia franciscana TaxID=6661 RepID=UPI0032DAB719
MESVRTQEQVGSSIVEVIHPGDTSDHALELTVCSTATQSEEVKAQNLVLVPPPNNRRHTIVSLNPNQESKIQDENTHTVAIGGTQYITMSDVSAARSYTALTPLNPISTCGLVNGPDVLVGETLSQAVQSSAYPVYSVSESATLYSPGGTTQYYTTTTASANNGTYSPGTSNQIIQNNAYIMPEGNTEGLTIIGSRNSPENDQQYIVATNQSNQSSQNQDDSRFGLAHANRVSPATVQWLLDNYETAEGVSLPRSTLYYHYLRHCEDHKIDPVNAASFGKLIRSVFVGLRTRRLGTRGNSKYHYYGIRLKPTSSLHGVPDDPSDSPRSNHGQNGQKKSRGASSPGSRSNHDSLMHENHSNSSSESPQHQHYLGDVNSAFSSMPDIEYEGKLPDGITHNDLQIFANLYREHCEVILDAVVQLQFSSVESVWHQFWRSSMNNISTECYMEEDPEKLLPKGKLLALCRLNSVIDFVKRADNQFYQSLVDVLLPNVLRPIPASLTQCIRSFSKNLEGWLLSAMMDCPENIVRVKVAAVNALSQTLRRYTSLNHLAQAARAVLHNESQINQMLSDLNRVDFHNIQEQASWVCQCNPTLVNSLETDFKLTLQNQVTLEQWASWLDGVVNRVLENHVGKPDFQKAARQFILHWSFYSSMVIRDLTLRSAASFGSFHLIRLLFDEYMYFLVEHKVAHERNETTVAIMGESSSCFTPYDYSSPDKSTGPPPSKRERIN